MTNNMDEFDQDDMDNADLSSDSQDGAEGRQGAKKNLVEAWKSQPIFKLMVIMGVVGIAVAGVLGVFSGDKVDNDSLLVSPPDMNEAPGSKASPYFNQQSKQASAQRAEIAMQEGGSAMPTPLGQNADFSDLGNDKSRDQLMEFRAEAERLRQELKQEQKQNVQVLTQQIQQRPREPEDNSLAQAMQRQMQQLMESWTPQKMAVIKGEAEKEVLTKNETKGIVTASSTTELAAQKAAVSTQKTIVQGGTVNYSQLLTEANSDVPSPILAQILSGPLAGARAIGRFQVSGDYLVIEFYLATLKGKDYPINAIALDPDTTLSGMATEVDHRYFTRVVLPAAASFVTTFGQALGNTSSSSTVSDGVVVSEQASQSAEDAIYAGVGQMGQTIGQFFQNQANDTKPLVRVAVGTPMGLFFLSSVREDDIRGDGLSDSTTNVPANNAALQTGYYNAQQGYAPLSQGTGVPYPTNNQAYPTYGTAPTYGNTSTVKNLTTGQPYPSNIYNQTR